MRISTWTAAAVILCVTAEPTTVRDTRSRRTVAPRYERSDMAQGHREVNVILKCRLAQPSKKEDDEPRTIRSHHTFRARGSPGGDSVNAHTSRADLASPPFAQSSCDDERGPTRCVAHIWWRRSCS